MGGLSSASSETKPPYDSGGGCTNKESALEFLSETGKPIEGLASLSFVFNEIILGTALLFS